MTERSLSLARTTILRWVKRYALGFVKRWNRFSRPAAQSRLVDETYVKIRNRWTYLYRAVDRSGKIIDFRLSTRRDVAAGEAFFKQAIKNQGCAPQNITLDGNAASHHAVRKMKVDGLLPCDTKIPFSI